MPKIAEFTRTEETEKGYKRKTIELIKQARKELDIPSYTSLSLKQFVGWLCSGRAHLTKNSWKSYKAAVRYYIEAEVEDSDKEEILDLIDTQRYDIQFEKPEPIGSAKKMKRFPIKQFNRLVSFLKKEEGFDQPYIQSQYSLGLTLWLEAGILTGLRPIEWAGAEYINEKDNERLVVKNAKNTNGRANGDVRTLILKHLTDEERAVIQKQVEVVSLFVKNNQFSEYQKNLSNLLSRAYKRLYPQSKEQPSLYSLRHQFAADAKASGFSTEEVAALMGHAVDDTATIHYAKKRSGNKSRVFKVQPKQEEVLTVKKVAKQSREKELDFDLERFKSLVFKK